MAGDYIPAPDAEFDGWQANWVTFAPAKPRGEWVLAWDTADDCDEFVEDYAAFRELKSRTMFRLGRQAVVYLFGYSKAEHEALAERFAARPPGFTRAGKPWIGRR